MPEKGIAVEVDKVKETLGHTGLADETVLPGAGIPEQADKEFTQNV
jgi:hypothetical protein